MRIGYARTSTREQNLDRQHDALTAAGCERIYSDQISTRKDWTARPQWSRMWEALRPGDVLVVHELDRMGRGLRDLLEIVAQLEARGVGLEILSGMFGGSGHGGHTPEQVLTRQILLTVAAAFAEYERNLNRARTLDGLDVARRVRGVRGGRRPKLTPLEADLLLSLYRDPSVSVASIARQFKVSTNTIRAYARRAAQSSAGQIENTTKRRTSAPAGDITNAPSGTRDGNPSPKPVSPPESTFSEPARGRKGHRN